MSIAIMLQGTGSNVGKSLLVAGLCCLLARRGLRVAPFKPQNMSNNAAVADDGGEIGRAQWLQAIAAGITPSVHFNPLLLKPQSDKTSQIIIRGKLLSAMSAKEYILFRKSLLPTILDSYHLLTEKYDVVLIEGAGSPAEINLRENDIANMGFARAINCPVIMVGDIERGGVIASLVGTHSVLDAADNKMIQGFIVNKFRGDAGLFTGGADEISRHTGWKNLGLIPYFADLAMLPQEDSLSLTASATSSSLLPNKLHISVLKTPYIANFDDIDPLRNDPNIFLTWVESGQTIPPSSDIVILAGSKSTIADLEFIRKQGWDIDLQAHRRRGGRIIGICGGYQMLGTIISDPDGKDGAACTVAGLGFIDASTVFAAEKTIRNIADSVSGYEIHLGQTEGASKSADGLVWGTYIHGLFADDNFRNSLLKTESNYNYRQHLQKILNDWADILENSIDIDKLLQIAASTAIAD